MAKNESLDKSNEKSYFARVIYAWVDGLMLASDFITNLMAKGRYTFVAEEAARGLGQSVVATRAALRRLRKKGEIAMPYRGFWVIVPPEYRIIGCLPPEQFIPQLMEQLGEPYYAGILTAAQYHGAAHHRPQLFQVVVAKNRLPIECGKVRVQFVARNNVADIPTAPFRTPRGDLKLSTPDATAFDLIGYPEHSAGLDNVATVLSELAERLDNRKLAEIAKLSPIVWSQRLGYLLDLVGAGDKTSDLAAYVVRKAPLPAPLDRAKPFKGTKKDARWRIMINTEVEADV